MGTDSAHRGVSDPSSALSYPGTLSHQFYLKTCLIIIFLRYCTSIPGLIYTCFTLFTILEAEGGLGQIYICEPVSRCESGSLLSNWTG